MCEAHRSDSGLGSLPNWVGLLHQLVDHFPRDELVDFDGASLRSNLGKWVLVDDLPIVRVVHELPRELDPLADLCCREPRGNQNCLGRFPR